MLERNRCSQTSPVATQSPDTTTLTALDKNVFIDAGMINESTSSSRRLVGLGVAFGLTFGVVLGAALRNVAMGIAIGVPLGAAIGAAFCARTTIIERHAATVFYSPLTPAHRAGSTNDYQEGEHSALFDWEFGGGSAVVLIWPSRCKSGARKLRCSFCFRAGNF